MNIIRELRKKAGVQQKELSIAIGVSQPTVSDWEKNKKDPSGENLKKLADFFGVDELVVMGNRRVIGSSPIWGAPETAVNKQTAVSFYSHEKEKTEKKNLD